MSGGNGRAGGRCALCERVRPLTFHHLVPRTLHSNKWFKRRFTREQMRDGIDVCRDCHTAIHRFISQKDLGRTYNNRDALLSHPQLARFVGWVATRQTKRIRTRTPIERRTDRRDPRRR